MLAGQTNSFAPAQCYSTSKPPDELETMPRTVTLTRVASKAQDNKSSIVSIKHGAVVAFSVLDLESDSKTIIHIFSSHESTNAR